jgi:hypothetical protein
VNDRCTRTRFNFVVANQFIAGGERLSHKLFLLQEDDDLCTGTRFKYLVTNWIEALIILLYRDSCQFCGREFFYCGRRSQE